jgi:hypothetical protein
MPVTLAYFKLQKAPKSEQSNYNFSQAWSLFFIAKLSASQNQQAP